MRGQHFNRNVCDFDVDMSFLANKYITVFENGQESI